MPDPVFLILIVIALIVGLGLGWLLGGRSASGLKAERDLHLDNFRRAIVDLESAQRERDQAREAAAALRPVAERAGALDAELRDARGRIETLASAKAGFERGEAERLNAYEVQLAQLKEMKAEIETKFAELAGKALEGAQTNFLKRADERFRQSEESAGQGLKALLAPVTERLQRYEEGVAKVEAERRDAFGDLKGQIEAMRIGQEKVSSEAAKLVNSLRNAPKSRGRWGEQQLKNVLETCGLTENCDFQTEVSVEGSEGARMRPDVIIRVPGGQSLVIDAKVSLNAYQDAFGANDEGERAGHLAAHTASMRAHVNGLGNKAYWSQFADAPDYVIMFVPGEHFLSAALEHDPSLWDFAFDKRVLLATPTNLIAIARTVAAVWRQERLAKEAAEIGRLGKELHARITKVGEHVAKMGRNLTLATGAYNDMVGSIEAQVMTQAKRFESLNVDTGAKQIEPLPVVDLAVRPLTKLLPNAQSDSNG